MKVHANAALGPADRLALVQAIESGMTQKAAAAAFCVAPATAHRWWHRWRLADEEHSQALGSGYSTAPRDPIASHADSRLPKKLRSCEHAARPTSAPVAWRGSVAGLARRSGRCFTATGSHGDVRAPGRPIADRRYEWSEPGALLHVDVARLARFNRPGHAVTGIRDLTGAEKRAGVGYVYLHCVINDHSRYAYVEQHRDQGGDTAAAVLGRVIEHFAALGMKAPEVVMSDNAFAYRRSNAFRAVLSAHGARHISSGSWPLRLIPRCRNVNTRIRTFGNDDFPSTGRTLAARPFALRDLAAYLDAPFALQRPVRYRIGRQFGAQATTSRQGGTPDERRRQDSRTHSHGSDCCNSTDSS